MKFIRTICVLYIFLFLIACHVDEGKIEPMLIHYPVPFYQREPGCVNASYVGIQTGRFTLINNDKGTWLLYDKLIDPKKMNNLAGLDEYIFIQLDLQCQMNELINKSKDVWGIQIYPFYFTDLAHETR